MPRCYVITHYASVGSISCVRRSRVPSARSAVLIVLSEQTATDFAESSASLCNAFQYTTAHSMTAHMATHDPHSLNKLLNVGRAQSHTHPFGCMLDTYNIYIFSTRTMKTPHMFYANRVATVYNWTNNLPGVGLPDYTCRNPIIHRLTRTGTRAHASRTRTIGRSRLLRFSASQSRSTNLNEPPIHPSPQWGVWWVDDALERSKNHKQLSKRRAAIRRRYFPRTHELVYELGYTRL